MTHRSKLLLGEETAELGGELLLDGLEESGGGKDVGKEGHMEGIVGGIGLAERTVGGEIEIGVSSRGNELCYESDIVAKVKDRFLTKIGIIHTDEG